MKSYIYKIRYEFNIFCQAIYNYLLLYNINNI